MNKIKGLQDISLTTNGILLEEYAEAIYHAGVRRINISLDSMNKEKFSSITNGGNLDAVLRGIARAEEVGFAPIKINAVAMKGFNDDEVLDFVQLAVTKPFQVRFIELMPVGKANLENGKDYLSVTEIKRKISEKYVLQEIKVKKNKSDGPARIFKIKGGVGEIGFINPVSTHFCSTCNRLRLTADGKLRVCLLKEEEVDLKKSLSENCSDFELQRLIKEAILLKPKHHDLDCSDSSCRLLPCSPTIEQCNPAAPQPLDRTGRN